MPCIGAAIVPFPAARPRRPRFGRAGGPPRRRRRRGRASSGSHSRTENRLPSTSTGTVRSIEALGRVASASASAGLDRRRRP